MALLRPMASTLVGPILNALAETASSFFRSGSPLPFVPSNWAQVQRLSLCKNSIFTAIFFSALVEPYMPFTSFVRTGSEFVGHPNN